MSVAAGVSKCNNYVLSVLVLCFHFYLLCKTFADLNTLLWTFIGEMSHISTHVYHES